MSGRDGALICPPRGHIIPMDENPPADKEALGQRLGELARKMESLRQQLDYLRTAAVAGSAERHRTSEELRATWEEWKRTCAELQALKGW